jgi:hypothetical protein
LTLDLRRLRPIALTLAIASFAMRTTNAFAGTAPVIVTQPVAVSSEVGTHPSFYATARDSPEPAIYGVPPRYPSIAPRWQLSVNGGKTWRDIGSGQLRTVSLSTVGTLYQFPVVTALENGNEFRAVFTNASGSVTTNAAKLTVIPTSTTQFSGYSAAVSGSERFTEVEATWTVPSVICPPSGALNYAEHIVHIGDFGVGTLVGCDTDMTPDYIALGGRNNRFLEQGHRVSPGDILTGEVRLSGVNYWVSRLRDAGKWTFTWIVPSSTLQVSNGTVHVGVQGPDQYEFGGCACFFLTDFGSTRFTGVWATVDVHHHHPITGFNPVAEQMTLGGPGNPGVLATPGPVANAAFTDTWVSGY